LSHFLSELPLWALISIVMVIPTLIAIAVQLLARRWIGVSRLSANNEVAGFQFAIVGVIYAVLLAFVIIAVWEKFSEGQTSVAQESAAAASLFRYADGPEPEAAALHRSLNHYLELVIAKDWPAMAAGSEDPETTRGLNDLYRAAMALNRTGTRSTADMSEVFAQADNLTSTRRLRLHLATGLVPDVIWVALFTGGFVTVAFALFFGAENLVAHLAMTAILSFLVTMGLVVIVSLDHPFSGSVHISPHSIEQVLASLEHE
jgi:hypothetical protein